MKKIMRIALVFALAGATLVGCTKDYSGDISDLNKKVTEQASSLSALQTQVGAAQTAADAAAQKAAEALAEAQKKASSADVQAAEERVNAKINDLVNGDVKALKDAVAALEGIKAGERLTDLETAIKDFVTKAEFAQELAALKDELEDAIAAGDKVNADAIAALEKKVEDILASLSINSVKVLDGYGEITAAYGKFTADGVKKAAEWKGPKAEEIAKIKKGDLVFGTGANKILVQVNPAGADITDAEISLQTSECVEAPIVFGTPVPYEGKLKSENGLWNLPFVVEEFTEEESKEIVNEFNEAKVALVIDGIRTDYDMTFKFAEDLNVVGAPEEITEKVAKATGKGEFVFAPADAPKILDAYITGIVNVKDSVRFDVTYDGMSFTYDVEKIQEWVEKQKAPEDIEFKISYINLVGAVGNVTGKLTITYKGEEPADPTVYQFATVAAHDAVAAYTAAGVSAADKETSRKAQSLVISFKEFYDEFAPTKAEKEVWDEDWHAAAATIGFYTAKKNSYDVWDTPDAVTGLVVDTETKFDFANSKLTIQFTENYGTATFAATEFFAAVVTFTNDDDETIKAVVPFKINAPSADEIAKWYDWNHKQAYDGSVLHIAQQNGNVTKFKLGNHFEATENYSDVTLLANVDSVQNPTTKIYKYTPHVQLQTFNDNANAYMEGKNKVQKEAALTEAEYQAAMLADFKQLRWNNWSYFSVIDSTDTDDCYLTPWYEFGNRNGYTGYNDLHVVFDNSGIYADKYLNAPLKISRLQIKAMGNRVFNIPDLTFQIDGDVVRTNSASFTKPLELGRASETFISLYNALYTPNVDVNEYFGGFTLKDKNGKALKLKNIGTDIDPDWSDVTVETATKLNENDEPIYDSALISISAFGYKSQINVNGAATPVGGLKISNDGLNTLGHSVKKVYVKISIPANEVLYVLDNTVYDNTASATYDVEFTIDVK